VTAGAVLPAAVCDLLAHVHPGCSELEYRPGRDDVEWIAIRRAQLGPQDGGSSIFILQDISGLKRLEREHETLRRRQALAEMSAVLAHEIRNPLGSLELFAGLLAESQLAPEERAWVEHLQAGLRTLAATVNNVLHFHSQPRPELAPTDMGELLRRLEQFLQPLAQRAQVRLTRLATLDGVCVAADRHRLEQVVLNLALNSFRFMPEGGVFVISGEAAGHKATVEFADSGPGIAPENLQRVFQPGFSTRAGSAGLGLAVCKTIMEQHGGSIAVSSRPGCGATFTLEFPLLGEAQ
jgi:two-component system sensor histidine kinase FlrB